MERHVFALGAMRRREEELGKLKATCLPEMAALLHQVRGWGSRVRWRWVWGGGVMIIIICWPHARLII